MAEHARAGLGKAADFAETANTVISQASRENILSTLEQATYSTGASQAPPRKSRVPCRNRANPASLHLSTATNKAASGRA